MLSKSVRFSGARFAAQAVPVRFFTPSARREYKVTVIGAAGGIGQPLSLLMKQNLDVTELRLYDLAPVTPGVAADISHIDTPAKVTGFTGGADELGKSLKGADVVIVPAGVPRKPGMTRDDLFNTNAGIVANIAKSVGENCPNAAVLIISNPVNSTVPIVAEVLKKAGKYNPKKLFGVTTLDVLRANAFVAENQKIDVTKIRVPVVGGHAGTTIVPLLSQVTGSKYTPEDKAALTKRIMFGGDEVVAAKAGAGSATLSMAVAGARFAGRVIQGLKGEKDVVECSFVESNVTAAPFFSSYVTLGKNGVEKVHGLGQLDAFEEQKIKEMLPDLIDQIGKGVAFVNK